MLNRSMKELWIKIKEIHHEIILKLTKIFIKIISIKTNKIVNLRKNQFILMI